MKVAVIGYGYWGPKVARALSRVLPEEQVVICEPDPEARSEAARVHPLSPLASDCQALLADPSLEAVHVCTPARSHHSVAREALLAGKHVLVEKPLAATLDEGLALAREARSRGLVLMAGHVYLYNAPLTALRDLLLDGRLGEPRYLCSQRTSLGPRVREDVSVVWDYLMHDAYLLPYLLGRRPEAVSAHGGSYLRPGLPDVVFARLDFGDGVFAGCHASWYDPLKVRRLTVVGSERMAVFDELSEDGRLTVLDRGYRLEPGRDSWGNAGLRLYDEGERTVAVREEEPLVAQARAFVEAARRGEPPPGHLEAVLDSLAVLEAVDRSLEDGGRLVPVEYPLPCLSHC
jgi:predicted dehydrogenase